MASTRGSCVLSYLYVFRGWATAFPRVAFKYQFNSAAEVVVELFERLPVDLMGSAGI